MLFRNIILIALIVAVISGTVLSILQAFTTVPIIYNAEQYEVPEPEKEATPATAMTPDTHSHNHDYASTKEWAPADGAERITYTFFADILIAFGHSLLLTSFMALMFLRFKRPTIDLKTGLVVGLGGYLSFYTATIVGLSPEIPGMIAADLHARQIWWTLTVVATVIGLSTLYLASGVSKAIGLILIAIPHIIGAPHPEVTGFLNQDPTAISVLKQLEHTFLISTVWINLVYWLILGATSGIFTHKFLKINLMRPLHKI